MFPMRVLITGGGGYLGGLLLRRLMAAGCAVRVFDRFLYGPAALVGADARAGLEVVAGDVRDPAAVREAAAGCGWIIHLAAIVGYPACAAAPALATAVNVGGTENLLRAMRRGQRLIFASTASVYGRVDGVADEGTEPAPLTLYGQSKRDGEEMVRDAGAQAVILRLATLFGPSPRMRLDLLINDLTWQAIRRGRVALYEGHFRRPFLHVADAAAAFLFAMTRFDAMAGSTFNVGDDRLDATKRQVAETIRRHHPYVLEESADGRDLDRRDYRVDFARIRSLGYRARVLLDPGIAALARFLASFREQPGCRNAAWITNTAAACAAGRGER
jgi:nucleoside-diphosphate-sugar epimerase